eukprot:scaffold58546_cov52-Prasinocladus_malaysianus.AAC.1
MANQRGCHSQSMPCRLDASNTLHTNDFSRPLRVTTLTKTAFSTNNNTTERPATTNVGTVTANHSKCFGSK